MTIVVTDNLTKLTFSNIPNTMPSTWYLGDFIPAGVLDISHLQVRVRPLTGYWSKWVQVTAWDPVTKIATYFRPIAALFVEFRRNTPRKAPWRDPRASTSRVSKQHLQINADQGVFVATEWAAEYGIDVKLPLLNEPGVGPNTLGLRQMTQNHWDTRADFTRKVWNFQFAGGYMDRAHVKAQVLLAAGWQALTIDPSENDPNSPSNAPFRFLGDYQLYLDLATLGEPVLGLIIYRHTPRTINVSSPADAVVITDTNMEPSARHSFFVAVEVGEEISRRAMPCECTQLLTSEPYAIVLEPEKMGMGVNYMSGRLQSTPFIFDKMEMSTTFVSGMLQTIVKNYTNWPEEKLDFTSTFTGGSLTQVVFPYTNWPEEKLDFTSTFLSGNLQVVVVAYSNYIEEKLDFTTTFLNGTLA